MDNILLVVAGVMVLAIVIHAYNMGWQAGHDIHHSDAEHGAPEPPEPPRTLWQ